MEYNEIILLKMGELVLKGLNRSNFERRLLDDAARRLKRVGRFSLTARQSTVTVTPQDANADISAAYDACALVFGVASLARAAAAPKEMDAIIKVATAYLEKPLRASRTFKVEAKRADKRFPLTSPEISREVGGALHDAYPHLTVDVTHPETTVYVEIRDTNAYIHINARPGAGGLPQGVGGKAVCLLSGGIDSPVATYLAAKRGLCVLPLHFFSHPYTSLEAKDKVISLARLLSVRCGPLILRLVPFTAIQEEILKKCPQDYFTLIMRRFMTAIAERVALRNGAGGLVTGESLGQVASQTLSALAVTGEGLSLPILRPLVCLDKEEIVTLARRIGTFETSTLPYEDCCTVFTPRHPRTNPRLFDVLKAESALDKASLIEGALLQIERVEI